VVFRVKKLIISRLLVISSLFYVASHTVLSIAIRPGWTIGILLSRRLIHSND